MGLGGPILRLVALRGCLDTVVFFEIISIPDRPVCLACCAARIDEVDSATSSPPFQATFADASLEGLLLLMACDGLRFKPFFAGFFLADLGGERVIFDSSISLSIVLKCCALEPAMRLSSFYLARSLDEVPILGTEAVSMFFLAARVVWVLL